MWSLLFVSLISFGNARDLPPQAVHASCDCVIYNDEGLIHSPSSFTGTQLPSLATSPYHPVSGQSPKIASDKTCEINEDGKLNKECFAEGMRAILNANYKCQEISQEINSSSDDPRLQKSHLLSESCRLTVEDNLH